MVTSARDILSEYEFYYPETIRTENLPVFLPRFVNGIHQREQVLKATKVLITKVATDTWTEEEKKKSASDQNKGEPKSKQSKKAKKIDEEIDDLPFTVEEEPTEKTTDAEIEVPKFIGKIQADILHMMPLDHPVSADDLAKQGQEVSTILSAMTMLEVGGLVRCLPGGLYQRLK